MYHSITFGDGSLYPSNHEKKGQFMGTNTWDDWHLIPSERPSIASPGVSTSFIEIPGRDGAIDMSTFLTNRLTYSNRSGSWDFYVANDYENWETIRMKIMTFLHGKRYKIVLEDDPDWYWEGRFAVDNWRSEAVTSRIQINYQIDPFKRKVRTSGSLDIVWDTFNFETDNDYYASMNDITLDNNTYTTEFLGTGYPFDVYATAGSSSNNIVVTLNGIETAVSRGSTVLIGKSQEGTNTVSATGVGKVTVHFTEVSL